MRLIETAKKKAAQFKKEWDVSSARYDELQVNKPKRDPVRQITPEEQAQINANAARTANALNTLQQLNGD